jgi:hypothetical protein
MEDTTMICSLCGERFTSERELRNHHRTVHAASVSSQRRSRDNENEYERDEEETAA